MKNSPLLILSMLGGSLVTGCAWLPWNTDTAEVSSREIHGRIVPHTRILEGADSAAAFHGLGRHLQREGRLDDAERAYRRALDFDPTFTESRNALAVISATRGNLAQAIAILSSLVISSPDQPHLLANLGYAHYLNGDYLQAKESLNRALMIAPDHESALQKLALVKEKLGEATDEQSNQPPTVEYYRLQKATVDVRDKNRIVKLTDGVYELIDSLPHEVAQSYAAQCNLPKTPNRREKTSIATVPSAGSFSGTLNITSPSPSPSPTRLRLELVNGNGVNRLAISVRELIAGPQWHVVRVLNHDEFGVSVTRIEYARHRHEAARSLANTLGVTAQLRPNYHQGDTQLRVVLGKDFRSTEDLKKRIANGIPALAEAE